MQHLISASELHKQLNNPDLIILDGTIPKVVGTNTPSEKRRIKGARFFDIKKAFSDQGSAFPNTLPTASRFENACRALGIRKNSTLVVYDDLGIYSSARVWWMLRTMGHSDITVLDGGLPAWEKEGFETEPAVDRVYGLGDFEATLNQEAVKSFEYIQTNILDEEALVIDARSADRFHSRVPEPRADLRGGNIEGSINIPYSDLLENGKFKPKEQLQALFKPLISEKRPLVFSCGSGITACVVALASESFLANNKAIYDGSWTEYALRTNQGK